jgi:pyruvate,water dikinase
MDEIRLFNQIQPSDVDVVGGKGLSLGMMIQAGLPVPPGFCVSTAAHRRLKGRLPLEDPLADAIADAYRRLGGGFVAVRSSATSEDGKTTSFAGQQETILGVTGEASLIESVGRCWESLDTERAVAYRKQQGVAEAGLSMAVVVQQLVPAEVAGVLFTRDPLDPTGNQMLVESAWGLGETVVSGQVTPDRFHLDRQTGQVRDRHISTKTVQRTAAGPEAVAPERQTVACLDDAQLAQLAELGREVERFYGEPRDVEWAWSQGRFWLLQARPITTADAAEREQVRREEIEGLKKLAAPAGTVWSRYNLAEVLPEPTPMSWAIVRRFMSGKGGYGLMYRDLGFKPATALDDAGVFDLVCGRPYCNLSREPMLYSSWLPYEHPFAALKAHPENAIYPQAVQNPSKAGAMFWLFLPLRLPFLLVGSIRFALRLGNLSKTFAERFRRQILPPYVEAIERELREDLSKLTPAALLERLEFWIHRALVDFARDSLKPTALAAIAIGNLERWLKKGLGPERTKAALGELSMGVQPEGEADFAGALRDVAAGKLDRSLFLERFGHRGPQEMELSQPRWGEDHEILDRLIRQTAGSLINEGASEEPRHSAWEKIVAEAKLGALQRTALEPEVEHLRTYLALRETAKHHLMRGYALIRRLLVELDRRFSLQGGIFFLTPDELPRLTAGENLTNVITQRRRRRSVVLSLEVPQVLFSDDLEAIGRAVKLEGVEELKGVPLSAGVAEAPALVLERPDLDAVPVEPYILVCPSTDPAWVPLFVRAKGLVMETGGVLSHGAIVAREFGLPAVAGLAEITRRLRTGQRLRVDGASGVVNVLK